METQLRSYDLMKTDVAEDGLSYVDVCVVNGSVQTHVFEKSGEPNNFASVFSEDGDTSETIRKSYEDTKTNGVQ